MSGIVMKHYKSDTSSTDQLYQYLTDHKHDQDTLLNSTELRAVIDAVNYSTNKAIESSKNFMVQKRMDQFYAFYPYFFHHIPNHALIEASSPATDTFLDFELNEVFRLNIERETFQFKVLNAFTLSPFQVSCCYFDDKLLTIELENQRTFKLNRNRFQLNLNPLVLENHEIYHLRNALIQAESTNLILFATDKEKPIEVPVKLNLNTELALDSNQKIMLETISQCLFSQFLIELQDLPEEQDYEKMLLEIKCQEIAHLPNPFPSLAFRTNLLPIINLFSDYSIDFDCDYSRETYAIKHLKDTEFYLPTRLHNVFYNKEAIYPESLNLNDNTSYNLKFEKTGHLRIGFDNIDVTQLGKSYPVQVYAEWTQAKSADVQKKNYTLEPLSRTLGNLKYKIIYNYGFKRNALFEHAENILKIFNVINSSGISRDIFIAILELLSNNQAKLIESVKSTLLKLTPISTSTYQLTIRDEFALSYIHFYANLIKQFVNINLSNQLDKKINFKIKIEGS